MEPSAGGLVARREQCGVDGAGADGDGAVPRPLTPEAEEQAASIDAAAIRAAMARAGNVRAAAALLGVARRTLDKRIVRLGLRDELRKAYPYPGRQPKGNPLQRRTT